MKLLVTGVLGFIFSNFVRRVVPEGTHEVVGIDNAARAHAFRNAYEAPGYKFHLADIRNQDVLDRIFRMHQPDWVIGGAAESFVDHAISDVLPFLQTNVLGTHHLCDACTRYGTKYLHISTDEVYGQQPSIDCVPWTEDAPLAPRNPYAVSKACAELVVRSAGETHGLAWRMVRPSNVYGPRQQDCNLIPTILRGLYRGEPIPIHGSGEQFRQWLYVEDAISGILAVLEQGKDGRVYNLGGQHLRSNLALVDELRAATGRHAEVRHAADRKTHDFGYYIDSTRAYDEIGWSARGVFASHDILPHYRERYAGTADAAE